MRYLYEIVHICYEYSVIFPKKYSKKARLCNISDSILKLLKSLRRHECLSLKQASLFLGLGKGSCYMSHVVVGRLTIFS